MAPDPISQWRRAAARAKEDVLDRDPEDAAFLTNAANLNDIVSTPETEGTRSVARPRTGRNAPRSPF